MFKESWVLRRRCRSLRFGGWLANFSPSVTGFMLNQLTISELTARLAAREVSAREAMQACLDQISRVDPQIQAFISYDAADALAQADSADRALANGGTHTQWPLLGVPVALKD